MERKIVFVPLDDRPCNKLFPQYLFGNADVKFTVLQDLGEKKNPADYSKLKEFLLEECKDAFGLVLSMDMLLYGGLLPSRLHKLEKGLLKERAELLHVLRRENPGLVIYAFQTIMRCPTYSGSMEEPDYYEICGHEIYKYGELMHKRQLGLPLDEDPEEMLSRILPGALEDYTSRRACNVSMDEESLEFVKDGTLDLLVFPQDDCSPYGYAAIDQEKVYAKIKEYGLEDRIAIYPGADEVGMTLTSRMVNAIHGRHPSVYVKYAAESARELIPLYEGSELCRTIEKHLKAAGCTQTDSFRDADIILAMSAAGAMQEAPGQLIQKMEHYRERNLEEFTDFLQEMMRAGKIVTLADNAYANGGDLELVRMLNEKNMLMELDGYAGWNTSANTLGTAIAEAIAAYYQGKTRSHRSFMAGRYLEDAGYCAVVRQSVSEQVKARGIECFYLSEKEGTFSRLAEEELQAFKADYLSSVADRVKILHLSMPWERMFEIDLQAEYLE